MHTTGFLLATVPVVALMQLARSPRAHHGLRLYRHSPARQPPLVLRPAGRVMVDPAYHRLHHTGHSARQPRCRANEDRDVLAGRARFPSRSDGVGRTGLDEPAGRGRAAHRQGQALLLVAGQLIEPLQAQGLIRGLQSLARERPYGRVADADDPAGWSVAIITPVVVVTLSVSRRAADAALGTGAPRTQDQRMDQEHVLVDQAPRHQRPDRPPLPRITRSWPGCCLSAATAPGGVAPQRGVAPWQWLGQRRRGDILAGVVEHLGVRVAGPAGPDAVEVLVRPPGRAAAPRPGPCSVPCARP